MLVYNVALRWQPVRRVGRLYWAKRSQRNDSHWRSKTTEKLQVYDRIRRASNGYTIRYRQSYTFTRLVANKDQ